MVSQMSQMANFGSGDVFKKLTIFSSIFDQILDPFFGWFLYEIVNTTFKKIGFPHIPDLGPVLGSKKGGPKMGSKMGSFLMIFGHFWVKFWVKFWTPFLGVLKIHEFCHKFVFNKV